MLAFERSQDGYTFWVFVAFVEKLARGFFKLMDLLRLPGRHVFDQITKLILARVFLDALNRETTFVLGSSLLHAGLLQGEHFFVCHFN